MTLMGQGSHIVSSASLYGGSVNLFKHTLPRFGIETTFVDPRKPEEFRQAIRPETRLFFGEIIGNPGLKILNVTSVAEIAHDNGIPLMIDATFNTPYLCKPFELGADIVSHSITKWMGGHGVAIGGIVVEGGRFDWEKDGKFPTLTEPYDGYHGINFFEEFGSLAGPIAAGILIAYINEWVYLVALISFIVSTLSAISLPDIGSGSKEIKRINLKVLLSGFVYVWKTKIVLGTMTIDIVAMLFSSVMGMLPIFAIDILDIGSEGLGILRATPSIGALFAAMTLSQLPSLRYLPALPAI